MAYNVSNEYKNIIYSGDAKHKLKLLFNGIEYNDSNIKTESVKVTSKILSNGDERFSLDNFVSKEVELVIHDIDLEDIVAPVSISIGTLIDENNETYEYVPIGIFNIDETPTTDNGKTTIKLKDNAVKFDFPYDGSEVIENNDGEATMLQILQDICTKAGVQLETTDFINKDTKVSVWDNSINARVYVMYISEKAGCIATINRSGNLELINLSQSSTIDLDPLLMESYKEGEKLQISRVVYEDAIRKFEYGNEDYGTLYINSSNPYITNTTEILNIYNSINGFNIYSMNISKILGNPAIDPWDIIQFTYNNKTYKTLGQNILTYNGVMLQQFDTQIGTNAKTQENVTLNTPESKFRKVSTEINQLDGTIKMIAGEVGQYDNRITKVEQDIDSIEQSVEVFENLKRNVISTNYLHITDAVPNYPLRFSIKNARQIFPSKTLYPSDSLYPKGSYLIIDKTLELSDDAKMIKLPTLHLKVKNGIYDEMVIEKNTIYVIHRIGMNQDGTTYILENETIENLGKIDIVLFDNENYIYLYSFKNESVIYELDYTTHSLFTDVFATEVYVNSEIEQTANQILLQVNEKVDEDEIIAKLNVAVEDGQGIVNLTGNTVTIDSDNFKLDANGKINATAGDIGGFNLTDTQFNSVVEKTYNFTEEDRVKVANYINGTGTLTDEELELYDIDKDGVVDSLDRTMIWRLINDTFDPGNGQKVKSELVINSTGPSMFFKTNAWISCNTIIAPNTIRTYSLHSENLSTNTINGKALNLGSLSGGDSYESNIREDSYIIYNGSGNTVFELNTNTSTPFLSINTVYAKNFVNTSLESQKKNFEKLNNALDIIKKSDIYSYNWNDEKDDDKKHYGLIIGKNYNTPKEFISNNGNGIDTYSMISICLQAIKEQQEQIEELQNEIKLLKEEK